jgi:hypothetical protein
VGSVADVALPIAGFIPLEVGERPRTALRQRAVIAVVRIVAVIDVTVVAAGAVEPWARPDEHAAQEPIRAVIAV